MDKLLIQKRLDKKLSEYARTLLADMPEAKGMSAAVAPVRLYPTPPKAFRNVPLEIACNLVSVPRYRALTNAQIVAKVQERFLGYKVPTNLMDRPIPSYLIGKIKGLLAANGTPLDLKTYNSLSKVKRALNGQALREQSERMVTARVAFGDEALVVNDRAYSVTLDAKGYRRVTIGGQKLRVDVLEKLLARDG